MASRVQSLADLFLARVAQMYDDLERTTDNPKVRSWARGTKIGQALVTTAIATGPNPYANGLDLVVMISLKRASIESNEAQTLLSPQEAELVLTTYRRAEETAWSLAERSLTPAQSKELRAMIEKFHRENADMRYPGFVRFSELSQYQVQNLKTRSLAPGSVLGLLYLDPFAGLDPVARELRETRMLAERATYLLQRMPLILEWQTRQIAADFFSLPEPQEFVKAATQFAGASERFVDATGTYPQAFKTEREAAIVQIEHAIDAQRRAMMDDLDKQRQAVMSDIDSQRKALTGDFDAQRRAIVTDLESQQSKLRDLLADVRSTLDRVEQAGASVNASTSQTIGSAEAGVRRTLVLAFWLALVLLGCALVGVPISALVYRRIVKSSPHAV